MSETEGNPNLHKICSVYIGMAVCILGLIGNMISIAVWNGINKKRSDAGKSAGVYLIVLAIVDSGLLIFFLLTESIQLLEPKIVHNTNYVLFYCYFGFPMYFFFIVASIWMVICVTVNRFIAVMYPHKAVVLNSLKITYSVVVATLLFSFAINIPHFFNFEIGTNGEGLSIIKETRYGKTKSAKWYDFWAHCMVLVLVPWFTILSLNSLIIYKLFSKKVKQVNRKGESKRERQTTIILLTVTISFLVFLIWQCLTQCFWMLNYEKDVKHIWFRVDSTYAFGRLGVVINSSINFLLYCLSGTMFRKHMRKMFCKRNGYVSFDSSSFRTSSTKSVSLTTNDISSDVKSSSPLPAINVDTVKSV